MVFVYVLYMKYGMILAEIEDIDILSADKQLKAMGIDAAKRNDIGCYPRDIFPKQHIQDFLNNFCSH